MGNGNGSVSSEDVLKLTPILETVMRDMKAQRDILRQRGMDLPTGTMQGIETLHRELQRLAPQISEQGYELEQLRTLAAVTAIINSSLNLDKALSSIMDTVLELTGAERGYIMLRNLSTGELQVQFARGMEQQDMDNQAVSRTVVEQVAQSGEPIVTTNAQLDTRFSDNKSVIGYNLRSILCVPLILKGETIGVVYADNRVKDGIFGKKELHLLAAMASQAALAIENARLYEQARAALQEITQIKNLLDNILASIASGVITTDGQNRVTTFNHSAESILGILDEHILEKTFANAVPELYEKIRDVLPNVWSSTASSINIEVDTLAREDQEAMNLNLRVSPLRDANNMVQGVALVLDDLTELKKRDKMLQAVRRYLPPAMVDNIRSIEKIGLAGERRNITALFVEVRPFNTFPAQLKAGQLMELLNVYMTAGTEAIHRRAGVIDKYMGSEIMGLFNTQLNPSETHGWDAVQAAIEMAMDFEELYKQMGEAPSLPYYRIGIHTGDATLGNVGGASRREFSAIGDTVNLAKRLQENATAGQLIISRQTYDFCRTSLDHLNFVTVTEREPLQVKGRLQAAQVYQIELHPEVRS